MLYQLAEASQKLTQEVSKVIIGQNEIVEGILLSLLTRGHSLLVGVPGLAKTLMVRTIARLLDLEFSRIQFTPDLMPSDITGTEILEEEHGTGRKHFRFIKGPLFAQIILADEINRTPPKTQSALLEAMQEHAVTAGGQTMKLKEPFFVLATQNPIEQEGTYPLPEAQLDRFLFMLKLDYPSFEEEVEIVKKDSTNVLQNLQPILNSETLIQLQAFTQKIPVAENVVRFAVQLTRNTRPDSPDITPELKSWIKWGAGPRASIGLIQAAKARAAMNGKPTPEIEDVYHVAPAILRHRIVLTFNAEADGKNADDVIDQIFRIMKVGDKR
ncbi:MAG: MoxR family ATPase [bacterium]|nr:MoxR family ATPase [bacterium]